MQKKRAFLLTHLLLLNGLAAIFMTGEIPYFILLLPILSYLWRLTLRNERVEEFVEKNLGYIAFLFIGILLSLTIYGLLTVLHSAAIFIILTSMFRILGPQTSRQWYQIILISLFEILSAGTLTGNIYFGLIAIIHIFLIPWALLFVFASSKMRGEEMAKEFSKFTFSAFVVMLSTASIIITAIVFAIFPRVTLALIKPITLEERFFSGFSESVNIGDTGKILQNTPVVMRVVPENPAKWRNKHFYLRGTSFESYKNGRWFNENLLKTKIELKKGIVILSRDIKKSVQDNVEKLTVYYETYIAEKLFYPYSTINIKINIPFLYAESDGTISLPQGKRPIKYVIFTKEKITNSIKNFPGDISNYLALSPEIKYDLKKFLQNNFKRTPEPEEIAKFFRQQFSYTLDLTRQDYDIDPVIDFLLNTKEGNCELFATATTLLLRSKGIPSRFVTGFLVHEWNDLGNYFVVREMNAHTWTEYLDSNSNWRVLDSTPSLEIIRSQEKAGVFARLIDIFKLMWIEYVLEYSLQKQIETVKNLKSFGRTFFSTGVLSKLKQIIKNQKSLIIVIILILWFMYFISRKFTIFSFKINHTKEEPLIKDYRKVLDILGKKLDLKRKKSETPLEFINRINKNIPHSLWIKLDTFNWRLYRYIFGNQKWTNPYKSLKNLKKKIKELKLS